MADLRNTQGMTSHWDNGVTRLYHSDARSIPLPDESVHCVVTSPPYWNLRDYGLAPSVWGGDSGCPHYWSEGVFGPGARSNDDKSGAKQLNANRRDRMPTSAFCGECGAWLGALGLEPTVDLYVAHIVEIFREVWRVLRRDGTCWINLGDSYSGRRDGKLKPKTWWGCPGESPSRSRTMAGGCGRPGSGKSRTRCRRASPTGSPRPTSMFSCSRNRAPVSIGLTPTVRASVPSRRQTIVTSTRRPARRWRPHRRAGGQKAPGGGGSTSGRGTITSSMGTPSANRWRRPASPAFPKPLFGSSEGARRTTATA